MERMIKISEYNSVLDRVRSYWACNTCELPLPHYKVDDPPSLHDCGCEWCIEYFLWKDGVQNIVPRWVTKELVIEMDRCPICWTENADAEWKCKLCKHIPCCLKCTPGIIETSFRICPLCHFSI
jgi:hypothetical protein